MVQARVRRIAPRVVAAAALATVMAGLLAGCNTTAGFGEDMQSAGTAVENSADKHKPQ
jgi:predicted small secreted protein